MDIDEYWKQFSELEKSTYFVIGGLYGFGELFGLTFGLINTIFLIK